MTENTAPDAAAPAAAQVTAAEKLDARIRKVAASIIDSTNTLHELIEKAETTQIHLLLTDPETGKPYATWQAYVTNVAKGMPPVRGKSDRRAQIRFLLGANLSVRAIAEIADVSKSLVQNVKTESPESVKPAATKGPGGKGAPQTHRKITERGALNSVNRLTENIDDLEDIDALAELLTALGHAAKAVTARREFLVKARDAARKSHPSSSEGNNGRTGQASTAAAA